MKKDKKKKAFNFPSAFSVLFIVLIFAAFLTYIIPAGLYSRLTYNDDKTFTITDQEGNEKVISASDKYLKDNGISIPLESFENGSIKKPIAIPNTYKKIKPNHQGIKEIIMASISGVEDSIDIIVFVLIIGGIIGLLNETGTFNAGMAALSKNTKGREFIMLAVIFALITIGGTTFGMAEETIALYPILLPIFLAVGYDAMVVIATIYLASCVGTMFSTVNPFSVVIASNAAGINFTTGQAFRVLGLVVTAIVTLLYIRKYANKVQKNPESSIIAEDMPRIKEKFLENYDPVNIVEFTLRKKITLIIFILSFVIMIWGVQSQGWWFEEMSGLFLTSAIIMMFLSGLNEKKAVSTFMNGAADLVSVALIIGLARGINIILDNGFISDTLLFSASKLINGMSGVVFSWVQMAIYSVLGIFIPSSSGLAALSMPIMAPLADAVNVGRDVVVSAYNYGQGWMAYITPTGLVIATLELVGVTYDKWFKWVIKLLGITIVISLIVLTLQVII
ncbi:MAG: YfcC family protein [Peptoniphilaceae bacterium]|nr:YfcC family protein [Peptoniphilaceae bacterium]MDY6018310.1 YfcC family protein [Anaerococcus sp.]